MSKGGTGKTTIASAFIKLSNAKAYADCDVNTEYKVDCFVWEGCGVCAEGRAANEAFGKTIKILNQ